MNAIERAREVIRIEIDGLAGVAERLDDTFPRAIDMLLDCLKRRGKIVVTGVGKNLHIAEKLSATLASTGATSVVLHPTQAVHGDLGILSRGDILLALSYSGESEELLAILPVVKRLGIPIVSLTADATNSLAACSDCNLLVTVDREACPFNMAPTASTTATLALGDAIAMVLLDARGFRREDYALLHPAGAIGRALLLRVRDVMRGAERLARITEEAPVREALLEMTRARAGSVAVVDRDGTLRGIFTDGDLRRRLADHPQLLDTAIRDVMTPDPLTVQPDQLAADLLHVFEQHNIDDLLVVDAEGRLVGAVDIQDLPKLKIL